MGLGRWCLTPLSTIFQLYRGILCQWEMVVLPIVYSHQNAWIIRTHKKRWMTPQSRRTHCTMVKIRKETTGQTMIYKTLHRKPMLRQHAQKTNAWATRTENQCMANTHRKPRVGQNPQKTNAWATRTPQKKRRWTASAFSLS